MHWKSMLGGPVMVVGLGLAAVMAGGLQHPAEPHRHPEGQQIANLLPSSPESIAAGRRLYAMYCRACHGVNGKGDGDMAHAGGVPANFTDEVWQHGSSDGEIFLVVRDGVSADMQPYKNRLNELDIWHLVNFVKSLERSGNR